MMKDACNFPLRGFHRSMLGPGEKALYDLLHRLLVSGDESFTYRGHIDGDVLGRVYAALHYDVPETYRLKRSLLFECHPAPLGGWVFKPNYELGGMMDTILENHASRIIREAEDDCRTDLEKELFVHDWFADNVEYTFDGYASEESEYGVYGAIVERKAVCMGISKAVSMILNRLGVDCGTYSCNEDRHMWNIVRLDGECYHLDVTWDMRDSHGHTVYDYFNLSDMEMARYHRVSRVTPVTGTRYNWYRMNGLEARGLDDIAVILGEAVRRKQKHLVFRNLAVPSDRIADTVFSVLHGHPAARKYSCSSCPDTGRVEVDIAYRSYGLGQVLHDEVYIDVAESAVHIHMLHHHIVQLVHEIPRWMIWDEEHHAFRIGIHDCHLGVLPHRHELRIAPRSILDDRLPPRGLSALVGPQEDDVAPLGPGLDPILLHSGGDSFQR